MRRQRGFTLMEVMVAIGITSLMGAMVAVSFNSSFQAQEVVTDEADHYRQVRIAMARMTREIGSAFVSDKYDPSRYRDQNERPSNFIGERDKLLFSSFAHQRMYVDAKESDQMVVEYRVDSSPDRDAKGRKDLLRRVKAIVQDRMERGGTEDILLEGVQKLEFEYWDSDRKEWDDEWDTRRTERKSKLPSRVRINLYAEDESGKEVRYSTQVRIMLNTELPRY